MEYFVARELEKSVQGIEGVVELTTTLSSGSCNIGLEISPDIKDFTEKVNEVKTAVSRAVMPADMENEPDVRYFKSSQRAVLDICLYNTNAKRLGFEERTVLQSRARFLGDRLTALPEVSDIGYSGALDHEVEITVLPERLLAYNISLADVMTAIRNNNVRQPAGSIKREPSKQVVTKVAKTKPTESDKTKKPAGIRPAMSSEIKITISAELITPEDIGKTIIRGNFDGNAVRVRDVANIKDQYKVSSSVQKINGFEAVRLRVTKSAEFGILESVDRVKKIVDEFRDSTLKNSPFKIVLASDGSRSVRDRLALIVSNGSFGFVLVLVSLFMFLNFRSGFWVAIGIPFSFCFAMIGLSLMGYTINNITLSAAIIVMGMIVDDAIIVSENFTRLREAGLSHAEAAVKGTATVMLPVIGSIVTTCIAFIPILFFEGRMGLMTRSLPPVIFFMLIASLMESIFILPSHLRLKMPQWIVNLKVLLLDPLLHRFRKQGKKGKTDCAHQEHLLWKVFRKGKKCKEPGEHPHWFYHVEKKYADILKVVLKRKKIVFVFFIGLLLLSGFLFKSTMKFVMYPREETTEIFITGETPRGSTKDMTEMKLRSLENVLDKYLGKEVEIYYTDIAQGRRGAVGMENRFALTIYIVDKTKRKMSSDDLIGLWKKEIDAIPGIEKVMFQKSRFGSSSGSAIDIAVLGNNEADRAGAVAMLHAAMTNDRIFQNAEIAEDLRDLEYSVSFRRDFINRIGVAASEITATLRAVAGGVLLFKHVTPDNDEIRYMLTVHSNSKKNLDTILSIPVANQSRYLVPLRDAVNVDERLMPSQIQRLEGKRVTRVYSDLNPRLKKSPLEAAEHLETRIFPKIQASFPTVTFAFQGEVKDTRASSGAFKTAIIMVLILIYLILAILFNSLSRPLIIMMIIPFGLAGVILAFAAHGMTAYGFYATLGALGLVGVVINAAIVMITKLDHEFRTHAPGKDIVTRVAETAATRLRAVTLTTLTTVAGLLPTAYGIFGYDSMLAEMMLAMSWGLIFGATITLFLLPSFYCLLQEIAAGVGRFFTGKPVVGIFLAFLFLPFFGGSDHLHAQTTNAVRTLGLEEYLATTRNNNLKFQMLMVDELSLAYQRQLLLPTEDIVLNALVSEDFGSDGMKGPTVSFGLSKLFAFTGSQLSASYSSSLSTVTDKRNSALAFSLAQPLLQNAFGKANRLKIRNAEVQTRLAEFEIKEAYENYLAEIISLYLSWYSLAEEKRVAEITLDRLKKMEDILRTRYRLRIADVADFNRMKIQVIQKEAQVGKIRLDYQAACWRLAEAMSLDKPVEAVPLFPDSPLWAALTFLDDGFDRALAGSRTVKIGEMLAQKGELTHGLAQDALLPTLNLTGTYSSAGINGYSAVGEDSSKLNVGLGMRYSFPSSLEKAAEQKASNDLRKVRMSLTNLRSSYKSSLSIARDSLTYQKRNIESLEEKARLMETIVTETTRAYEQGRVSLSDLLREINTLDEYRKELVAGQIQYFSSAISWYKLTDTLLEQFGK